MKTTQKNSTGILGIGQMTLTMISHRNLTRQIMLAMMLISSLLLFANSPADPKESDPTDPESGTPNYITQTKFTQNSTTPGDALEMLREGNERFVEQKMVSRNYLKQVEMTSTGQYPIAAVVSCIDSRIPTEIVFNKGVGDIFNARIAGNFVNEDILGSLEFATKVAGAKAIVVMGHTQCGAVKGAADQVEMGNLTKLIDKLEPAVYAVDDVEGEKNSSNPDYVQKIADKNVELTIEKIKTDSPILNEMYENGEIAIVGAMYDVESGEVTFFD